MFTVHTFLEYPSSYCCIVNLFRAVVIIDQQSLIILNPLIIINHHPSTITITIINHSRSSSPSSYEKHPYLSWLIGHEAIRPAAAPSWLRSGLGRDITTGVGETVSTAMVGGGAGIIIWNMTTEVHRKCKCLAFPESTATRHCASKAL